MEEVLVKLFGFGSATTLYSWKKDPKRKIFDLIFRYFDRKDLEEFLETQKIQKFEKNKFLYNEVVQKNRIRYLESFTVRNPYGSLSQSHIVFISFYFQLLKKLKESKEKYKEPYFDIGSDFYKYDFSYLLQQHLLQQSLLIYQHESDVYTVIDWHNNLYKHFDIFEGWDSYMLFFLNECFESEFEILLDENDDKKLQDEANYHIEKWKEIVKTL